MEIYSISFISFIFICRDYRCVNEGEQIGNCDAKHTIALPKKYETLLPLQTKRYYIISNIYVVLCISRVFRDIRLPFVKIKFYIIIVVYD